MGVLAKNLQAGFKRRTYVHTCVSDTQRLTVNPFPSTWQLARPPFNSFQPTRSHISFHVDTMSHNPPSTHHDVLIVVQGPVVFLFFHVDFSSTWHESRPSCSCLCQPKQKGYDRANRTEDGATDCSRSIMMHMILFW